MFVYEFMTLLAKMCLKSLKLLFRLWQRGTFTLLICYLKDFTCFHTREIVIVIVRMQDALPTAHMQHIYKDGLELHICYVQHICKVC